MGTMTLRWLATIGALALSLLEVSTAEAQNWVPCGEEKKICSIPSGEFVRVRYGIDNNYTYFDLSGVTKIRCDNRAGDVAPGRRKKCWYTPLTADQKEQLQKPFEDCTADNSPVCRVPNGPSLVRYGHGKSWVYRIAEGMIPCMVDSFGDPGVTNKDCEVQLGPPLFGATPKWRDCASQNSECSLGTPNPGAPGSQDATYVRYGNGATSIVTLMTAQDPVRCDKRAFGNAWQVKGGTPKCDTLPSTIEITSMEGAWALVGSCNGTGCDLSETTKLGVRSDNTRSSTKEWSVAVTAAYQAFGASGAVTTTVGGSRALAQGLGYEAATSKTTTCGNPPAGTAPQNKALYQYQFDVEDACRGLGQCQSTIFTSYMVCAYDPPGGAAQFKPSCAPGCCSDDAPNCTVCEDSPACK